MGGKAASWGWDLGCFEGIAPYEKPESKKNIVICF